MELIIDTSTERACLALALRGELQAELSWLSGQNQTAELLPGLLRLLDTVDIKLEGLTAIIVARGPGSFTGLRVGMSTAKGLAFALNLPLIGLGTLEAQAYPYAATGLPIYPLQEAGRGEMACALYQQRRQRWLCLLEEHLTTPEELASRVRGSALFCGDLSAAMAQKLRGLLKGRARPIAPLSSQAAALARLGWQRLERTEVDPPDTLQPLYLRRPPLPAPMESR